MAGTSGAAYRSLPRPVRQRSAHDSDRDGFVQRQSNTTQATDLHTARADCPDHRPPAFARWREGRRGSPNERADPLESLAPFLVCQLQILRIPADVRRRVGTHRYDSQGVLFGILQTRFHNFRRNALTSVLGKHTDVRDDKILPVLNVIQLGELPIDQHFECMICLVMGDCQFIQIHLHEIILSYFCFSRANNATNSMMIFSAAKTVASDGSSGGATSTRSRPTSGRPCMDLMRVITSREVSPPASGMPVPGANAGSRQSMSTEIWTASHLLNLLYTLEATLFIPRSAIRAAV